MKLPGEITKPILIKSGAVGNQKIFIGGLDNKLHYTLHFGEKSKVIDIHIKDETTGTYVSTITKMTHFQCARLLIRFNQYALLAARKYMFNKKTNISKLEKHHCILFRMQNEDSVTEQFFESRKRGNTEKIRFQPTIDSELLESLFIYPSEALKVNSMWFMVFKRKNNAIRHNGYLYKDPFNLTSKKQYFVPKRNFMLFVYSLNLMFLKALESVEFENKDSILISIRTGKNDYINKISNSIRRDLEKRKNRRSNN